MHATFDTAIQNMFHLHLSLMEKVLRPVIVYLCLIGFLRLFGKRELAQLNPFDLVVLLSLANTVQNAIIGEDTSITGGMLGAFSLLAVNWLLTNILYRAPKLNAALEGSPTVLIRNGLVDQDALRAEKLTPEEMLTVLNRNNFSHAREVELCILEPNGTFYVKGKTPALDEVERADVLKALQALTAEVQALRSEIGRNAVDGGA